MTLKFTLKNISEDQEKLIQRAYKVQKKGCRSIACPDCILHNVLCNVDYLGDTPSDDSKILMTGFFIGLKFAEEIKK